MADLQGLYVKATNICESNGTILLPSEAAGARIAQYGSPAGALEAALATARNRMAARTLMGIARPSVPRLMFRTALRLARDDHCSMKSVPRKEKSTG